MTLSHSLIYGSSDQVWLLNGSQTQISGNILGHLLITVVFEDFTSYNKSRIITIVLSNYNYYSVSYSVFIFWLCQSCTVKFKIRRVTKLLKFLISVDSEQRLQKFSKINAEFPRLQPTLTGNLRGRNRLIHGIQVWRKIWRILDTRVR